MCSSPDAGAGATLNGFEISGTSGFGAGLDRPVGVLIGADNVDVSNNVLTGSAADTRPFDAYNGADGFSVHDNLVTGWSEGAYIVAGTSGTIEDNVFENNGNGIVTELTEVEITGNSFENSEGAHISAAPSVDTTIGGYIHDNTFLDQDRPISVYLIGAADNVVGSERFRDVPRRISRRCGHHRRRRRRRRLHRRQFGRRDPRGTATPAPIRCGAR